MAQAHKKNFFLAKGFTLIELIMTVAILAFGIVAIYEAFFISVDTFGFYTHYFSTQDWVNEKIWETQEELIKSKILEIEQTSGQIVRDRKTFDWVMVVSQLNDGQNLYRVNVTLSWKEGNKRVSTSREAYLLPPQLRTYDEKGSV